MLLILAEANAFNTSGAYNEFPKWGRRPKAAGPIAAPDCTGQFLIPTTFKTSVCPMLLKSAVANAFRISGGQCFEY